MNCVACSIKSCRIAESCKTEKFNPDELIVRYALPENQAIVQAAARLVDDGLAGTLTRLEELVIFIKQHGYRKAGMAYCYGMESEARKVSDYFKDHGINIAMVSCTVGGLSQKQINGKSDLCGVSCNPLGQATQLYAEGVDFAIQFGLCLGHDILFTRTFPGDQTVLVVKDRVYGQRQVI